MIPDATSSGDRIAPMLAAASFAATAVPSLVFGPAAIAIGVGFCVAVLVLVGKPLRWPPRLAELLRSPLAFLVGLVLISWIPSLILSLDPLRSLEGWLQTTALIAIAAYVWAELECSARVVSILQRTLLIASLLSVALALSCVYVASEILSWIRFQGWQPRDAVVDLKSFASAAALLIPVIAWAGWRLGGAWRGLAAVSAVAILALIEATAARSPVAGLLGILMFTVTCYVVRSGHRRAALLIAPLILLAFAGATEFLVVKARDVDNIRFEPYLPTWLADQHRQIIWQFTLDKALEAPLFGYGINAVEQVDGADRKIPGMGGGAVLLPSHPHNWVLEIFAETGVVGLLPMLVLVASSMVWLARDFVRSGRAESLVAGAVSAGYWASGLFNFSFWTAWWQTAYLILVAIVLSAGSTVGAPRGHDFRVRAASG
jgi:O-antigen ligase